MKHIVNRMRAIFQIGGHSVILTKTMKTHIRRKQHKKNKHQDIKQKEPPQKYRLGTISNKKFEFDWPSGFREDVH